MEKTRTILLVDDDEHIRKLYVEEFKAVFGDKIKTITFRDGTSAFNFMNKHASRVHLIISNILMPGIDGIMLLKICKKIAPDIPFIVNTSYTHIAESIEEADDYIIKNASLLELLNAIRRFLNIYDSDTPRTEAHGLSDRIGIPLPPQPKGRGFREAYEVQKKEISDLNIGDSIGEKYKIFDILSNVTMPSDSSDCPICSSSMNFDLESHSYVCEKCVYSVSVGNLNIEDCRIDEYSSIAPYLRDIKESQRSDNPRIKMLLKELTLLKQFLEKNTITQEQRDQIYKLLSNLYYGI